MENKARKQQSATTRTSKSANRRKEKKYKSAKLFRRKSLRSVGQFVSRILKTLGTLAHLGDAGGPPPPDAAAAEDDDGGFKECSSALKSATSGNYNHHDHDEVHGAARSVKKSSSVLRSSSSSSHGSVKDRLSRCFGDKTPGAQGLKNHGNTCFMNAVVQCLSNTDLLAEYLGLELYKWDMCRDRGGAKGLLVNHGGQEEEEEDGGGGGEQQKSATRGEVTEQLASLVRALWTLEYTPQISVDFKVRGSGTTRPAALSRLKEGLGSV
ncbi:hypothetical protein CRUP_018959 [Coryphaenoides rupestris]|nr:hypothetical protein CRUP_018959 [Coryphaenoides rupestris]